MNDADQEAVEILQRLYFEAATAFAALVLNNAIKHLMEAECERQRSSRIAA